MSAVDWSTAPAPWNFLGPEMARQLREGCADVQSEAVLTKRREMFQPKGCTRGTICWVLNGASAYCTLNDGKKNHQHRCLGCLDKIVLG